MPPIDRRSIQNFDWLLLGLALVLIAMGLVNLVSATHTGSGISHQVDRQLVSLAVDGPFSGAVPAGDDTRSPASSQRCCCSS